MPPGKEQPPPSAGGRQALPERAPCTNGVTAPASAPGVSRLPHLPRTPVLGPRKLTYCPGSFPLGFQVNRPKWNAAEWHTVGRIHARTTRGPSPRRQ